MFPLALLALLPALTLAAPAPAPAPAEWSSPSALKEFATPSSWYAGAHKAFTAHPSCNATEKRLIGDGLDEALMLAGQARAHLRRYGNDTIFQAWFGNETDSNTLLGLYDRLVDGDKTGLTFRCYFRADAKDETVVCPTYYLAKPQLENMCTLGQTLVKNGSEPLSEPVTQGAWFMHRLLHNPTASGGLLSDVVDTVAEALELAQSVNHTQAAYSIHSVQYYALDVYASDIILPGVGCRGNVNDA
ncbi:hypothetical protein JCM8547_006775 [Rhodosporidiobolus lusitaniae]